MIISYQNSIKFGSFADIKMDKFHITSILEYFSDEYQLSTIVCSMFAGLSVTNGSHGEKKKYCTSRRYDTSE